MRSVNLANYPNAHLRTYPSVYSSTSVFRIASSVTTYDDGIERDSPLDFEHDVQTVFCFKGSRGQGGEAEQEVVHRACEGEAAGQVEQSASWEVSRWDGKRGDDMVVLTIDVATAP